jgi:hypothetical protein
MPSTRSLALAAGVAALASLPGVAVAQSVGQSSEPGLVAELAIRLVAGLVVYGLLGGGLVALAPEYADETVAGITDDPGSAFGWGVVAGVLVPIALAVLAATVVGLVVAIPGVVVLFFVGVVGNAVTVVWVGTWFGDARPGAEAAALGAIAMAVVGAVPLLGGLLTTLVGFFGLGVVTRRLYRAWQGDDGPGTGRETPARRRSRHEDL